MDVPVSNIDYIITKLPLLIFRDLSKVMLRSTKMTDSMLILHAGPKYLLVKLLLTSDMGISSLTSHAILWGRAPQINGRSDSWSKTCEDVSVKIPSTAPNITQDF